jgi:hypothetical protein
MTAGGSLLRVAVMHETFHCVIGYMSALVTLHSDIRNILTFRQNN